MLTISLLLRTPPRTSGGYKPDWWNAFDALRTRVPKYPTFNTAGAPVTRKVLQNSDVVVVQLTDSTLWDGIGAGLIAEAGGYVYKLGATEAQPIEHVADWFATFGYERRADDPGRLTERYCVPAFVAGMDPERTAEIASVVADVI